LGIKSIIIFVDWYLPGFKAGGPIQSVSNFVSSFKTEFDISIVTSDRDLGDDKPYSNLKLNEWVSFNGYKVMYLDRQHQNNKIYRSLFTEKKYDFVYLNSLFSLPFTIKPLYEARKYGLKIVLAPRGMLGDGSLKIKTFKKRVFLFFTRFIRFFKHITWHATTKEEIRNIKVYIGKHAEIKLAPNLAVLAQNFVPRQKNINCLRLFYLSRISSIKNLHNALNMLRNVQSSYSVQYFIIGPVDDKNYWARCNEIINTLPAHISVEYLGAVPNHKLFEILKCYHFLFLPTLHENYGHAIIESMIAGCPVIISDKTPWLNLYEKGVGWDIALDNPDKFTGAIETCARMGQGEYNAMSLRAYEYAKQVTENPEVVETNRRLFEN
jgi:glycosyltransferase involved in cell wall biosynthesis